MKLNIAIAGCDTSHAVEFSRIFNDEQSSDHVPGARVIAAVVDGHGAMAGSRTKAFAYAAEIEAKYGVKLYPEIGDLPHSCDAVIIGATDCARHLELVEELVKLRVPLFVNKPLAPSGAEAQRIFHVGREMNVPIMTASALRYDSHFRQALRATDGKPVIGADMFGTMEIVEGGQGFLWYGIHMAELLFAAMGTGIEEVAVVHREFYDVITGVWQGGRIGTIRGMRTPHHLFGGTLHNAEGPIAFAVPEDGIPCYAELLKQIVTFASTGVSPIPREESIEIIRFLEAAERLRAQPIPLTAA